MQNKLRRREILPKRILYICAVICIVTLLCVLYHNYTVRDMNILGVTFAAALMPLTVPVAFKLLRFKPAYEIYIVSTISTYFAFLIGSRYHWYSYLGLDRVLHLSGGWFVTTLAVTLYLYLKKTNEFPDKKDYHIFPVFINAVNVVVGEIWESYEYAMLISFNNDYTNHYPQGVHDAIIGVLCTTVAGILPTLLIMRHHKIGKGNFFTNVYGKFYECSIVGKQTGSDNIRLTGVCCITNMMIRNGSG